MSQSEQSKLKKKIFQLHTYGGRDMLTFVVITSPDIDANTIIAAWSYAVRYTAKGLDLPDHDKAIELLKRRHPSWEIVEATIQKIPVDLNQADKDIPENA
jgi:hypothetical protein